MLFCHLLSLVCSFTLDKSKKEKGEKIKKKEKPKEKEKKKGREKKEAHWEYHINIQERELSISL